MKASYQMNEQQWFNVFDLSTLPYSLVVNPIKVEIVVPSLASTIAPLMGKLKLDGWIVVPAVIAKAAPEKERIGPTANSVPVDPLQMTQSNHQKNPKRGESLHRCRLL